MSEHWKSTPKYWCKHCKTYVRDTKFEKQQHDATPRHQGNLKRFVKDLHKSHEREEREKDRAKSEVARLNGLVAGPSKAGPSGFANGSAPSFSGPKAGGNTRKEQLAQLAEMGVAIPDEFRGELSMSGDWQVVSQRIIDSDGKDQNPESLGIGVRKREALDEEEEEEAKETKRRRWETTHRTHDGGEDDDLDALLTKPMKGKATAGIPAVKEEPGEPVGMKQEDIAKLEPDVGLVLEDVPSIDQDPGIVFKKRSKKNIRQKG